MSMKRIFVRIALAGWALAALAVLPASADNITKSQIAAAKAAVAASGASRGYDDLLPAMSQAVQNELIRLRPDLHAQITDVVEGEALKLVVRRPELDTAIARIWAAQFTEEELNASPPSIQSAAGQKFLQFGPKVISELAAGGAGVVRPRPRGAAREVARDAEEPGRRILAARPARLPPNVARIARNDLTMTTISSSSAPAQAVCAPRGLPPRYGARVAIAEEDKVGGTCVLRGCVPKKLFVYAAHFAEALRTPSASAG